MHLKGKTENPNIVLFFKDIFNHSLYNKILVVTPKLIQRIPVYVDLSLIEDEFIFSSFCQ